jgi:hypothetical protein
VAAEADDDPLVPALTEINGCGELGSTLTPVLALPLGAKPPRVAPFPVES